MEYYLRMEAVNLSGVIEDTADLSTIRGSSLMLLESVNAVKEKFGFLKSITTGASGGLFSFDSGDKSADDVRDEVERFLASHPQYRYATYVVDVSPVVSDDFVRNKKRMIALNRWRQWRQPTVIIPEYNSNSEAKPCAENRLHPSKTEIGVNDESKWISASVYARRTIGRQEKKKKFYADLFEECHDPGFNEVFVNSFEELTDDVSQGSLHHKMAVIYADGNHFGKVQSESCTNAHRQKDFDDDLKKYRKDVLYSLIREMIGDTGFQKVSNGQRTLRMETLLWGGDEFIWVVPAWRGWKTLAHFYDQAKTWEFDSKPLYHAAGMVFCHHKAPIHGITGLCRLLADAAKADDRKKNLFQYLVLESFDHIGQGLESFRKTQFPGFFSDEGFSLNGESMQNMMGLVENLKKYFPRRKIAEMAHASVRFDSDKDTDGKKYAESCERLRKTVSEEGILAMRKIIESHFFSRFDELTAWIHLDQLWDYFPEPSETIES